MIERDDLVLELEPPDRTGALPTMRGCTCRSLSTSAGRRSSSTRPVLAPQSEDVHRSSQRYDSPPPSSYRRYDTPAHLSARPDAGRSDFAPRAGPSTERSRPPAVPSWRREEVTRLGGTGPRRSDAGRPSARPAQLNPFAAFERPRADVDASVPRRGPPMGRKATEAMRAAERRAGGRPQPSSRGTLRQRTGSSSVKPVDPGARTEAATAEAKAAAVELEADEDEADDLDLEAATDDPRRPLSRHARQIETDKRLRLAREAGRLERLERERIDDAARARVHKAVEIDDSEARRVDLPSTIVAGNLSRLLNVRTSVVQRAMVSVGLADTRIDRLLSAEDASLVVLELGFDPVFDDAAAFDLFPAPPHPEPATLPARPPIVCIMGHVDHGKTTLLDTLRSTSVAAGEAGGITQHIGAFEVPINALYAGAGRADAAKTATGTITFLDTPGHAAFSAMRSRGATVTDVVILVVAADDGVRPQTKEVIGLITGDREVGIVVAITKCDKPGVDVARVKTELHEAGISVEDVGGDIPCVEVSAVSRTGLDTLVETVSAVAEVRELTAERQGVRVEGRVIESHIDKGRGNVATVLVTRGRLAVGQVIVAGHARAKVRLLTPPIGKAVKFALPGQPVEIAGWKELPMAGDEVLEALDETEARRAIEGRIKRAERVKQIADVQAINLKARADAEAHNVIARKKAAIAAAKRQGEYVDQTAVEALEQAIEDRADQADTTIVDEHGQRVKPAAELVLVVRADFQGTLEAVTEALGAIGNAEAKTKIVSTGVGPITDGDVALAQSVGGMVIGFNVKAPGAVTKAATSASVPLVTEPIIYRLIDNVTERVVDLLPKIFDAHVLGEAEVAQTFEITLGARSKRTVAGCRVENGSISRTATCRIIRGGETIHEGTLDTLKSFKKDVQAVTKGGECGLSFDGFDGFKVGDRVQAFELKARTRHL